MLPITGDRFDPAGRLLDLTAKRPKSSVEVMRRLPVMRLSMVAQHLLAVEQSKTKAAMQVRGRQASRHTMPCPG